MRTIYAIKDTRGETLAEHVRVDLPGGKKSMYWQRPGCDPRDGLLGLGVADLPLYGSECIPGFTFGQVVVITEGERARDALVSLGIDAVATVTGAASTPGEDALSPLLPFDVVTWEDNDDPGHAHMKRVAARIVGLSGRARRIIWGSRKGDDAADFVERVGTLVPIARVVDLAANWQIERPAPIRPVRPSYDRGDDDHRVQAARSHLLQVVESKLGPPKKKDGRSLFWSCPFHQGDRDPSFKVDLKEPFYRCFGCDARGDVFTFLREIEGRDFKDALRELAPPRLLGAAIPW